MANWLGLAAALAWGASAGWAVDWTTLKPEGYVSDFAQVIDKDSRARLEAYCAAVEQATGARMALVTLPSLQSEPPADVAKIIFRAWGVGQKATNQGVLLLLSIGDHRSRLEVGHGLEPILRDAMAGRVLREMRPALRRKDYGDALVAAAQTIGGAIAQAKHVTLNQRLARRTRPGILDVFPWPVLLGGLLLLVWLMRAGAPRGYGGFGTGGFLPALLLGNALGRASWGGNGSGGFGGYDSGDTFGGFGGGDSGGGGASSDW